jgi:anti-sigma regulatory factor (Ser/Thr protein kinase)
MEDGDGFPVADARHILRLYRSTDEYLAAISGFILDADAAGESVLIAVPGDRQRLVRGAVGPGATLTDMSELGRNPARIIPALCAFIDSSAGRPVSFVSEPTWPGRSESEIGEVLRHEALVNLAISGRRATMLCLYAATGLPERIMAEIRRAHPLLFGPAGPEPNPAFTGTAPPGYCDQPLPAVPAGAPMLKYRENLREVRDLVADHARIAGLPSSRAGDFALAASEIAANTLRHTEGEGTVSLWRSPTELICQLEDGGHIADPLAGRRPPDHDRPGGHGLWLVNQVCDLVELRSGAAGTAVRLHVRLGQPSR